MTGLQSRRLHREAARRVGAARAHEYLHARACEAFGVASLADIGDLQYRQLLDEARGYTHRRIDLAPIPRLLLDEIEFSGWWVPDDLQAQIVEALTIVQQADGSTDEQLRDLLRDLRRVGLRTLFGIIPAFLRAASAAPKGADYLRGFIPQRAGSHNAR